MTTTPVDGRSPEGRAGTTGLADTTRMEKVVNKRVLSGAILDLQFNVAAAEVAGLPLPTFETFEITGKVTAPSAPSPITHTRAVSEDA